MATAAHGSSDSSAVDAQQLTVAHGHDMPVAMHRMRMSAGLLEYILGDEIFTAEESRLANLGFTACCDHPAVPEHRYWEGYFHGLPEPQHVRSINPRDGSPIDKP